MPDDTPITVPLPKSTVDPDLKAVKADVPEPKAIPLTQSNFDIEHQKVTDLQKDFQRILEALSLQIIVLNDLVTTGGTTQDRQNLLTKLIAIKTDIINNALADVTIIHTNAAIKEKEAAAAKVTARATSRTTATVNPGLRSPVATAAPAKPAFTNPVTPKKTI